MERIHEPLEAANAIAAMLSRLGVDRDPADRKILETELARLATASPLAVGRLTPCDAAELVLEMAATAREPADPRADEIELLGWLELLLEPAPHLCIVGMNEGSVPDRGDAVAWLTPSMASALGLPDPESRLARDAAMLEALRRFRPGVRLVFGRRSAAGDPTMPSRLLLGGSGPDLAKRVRTLFREPRGVRRAAVGREKSAFTVPQPPADLAKKFEIIGVTGHRLWIPTGNHGAAPEVQNGVAMLVRRRHLERDDARGRSARLRLVLTHSDHACSRVQRVTHENGSTEYEAFVEEIGLDSLRGPSRLTDRNVDGQQRMAERRCGPRDA